MRYSLKEESRATYARLNPSGQGQEAGLAHLRRVWRVLVATDGGELEVYRNEEVMKGRGHRWEEILQLKPDVVITRETRILCL
jgi:ABC-type Fe3+-hydroxamate transport system substrate-binding protein